MSCLIGYTGFVGKNLLYQYGQKYFQNLYNSKNIEKIENKSFKTIFCAGVPANKWWANQNPETDLQNITTLLELLKTVKCDEFILISTIDVYNINISEQDEEHLEITDNHAYGRNRLFFENSLREHFPIIRTFRLPALFGFGLKKNIIYDLIHNNQVEKINSNSSYQWYPTSRLLKDIEWGRKRDLTIINLFTEPLETNKILDFFPGVKVSNSTNISYNIKSIYFENGYLMSSEDVYQELLVYISLMKDDKLLISNLGLKEIVDLSDYGISKLEIAPYKFNNNQDFLNREFIEKCSKYDIYSWQGWMYPLKIEIFKQTEEFIEYSKKIIEYASLSGAKILVFGSPKNRLINEDFKYDTAISLFRQIGEIAYSKNIIFCIEPNSKKYGCNFITNSEEGRKLVKSVDHPGFGLHLDIGNMFMENEDILFELKESLPLLKHVHFSAPYLKTLTNVIPYKKIYQILLDLKYNGKISLEYLENEDLPQEILMRIF